MCSRHRPGWDIALRGEEGEDSGLQSPHGTAGEKDLPGKVGTGTHLWAGGALSHSQTLARTLLTATGGPCHTRDKGQSLPVTPGLSLTEHPPQDAVTSFIPEPGQQHRHPALY